MHGKPQDGNFFLTFSKIHSWVKHYNLHGTVVMLNRLWNEFSTDLFLKIWYEKPMNWKTATPRDQNKKVWEREDILYNRYWKWLEFYLVAMLLCILAYTHTTHTYTHSHTHTFTYILYYRIIYRRLRSYSSLSNSFKFRHYGPPRRVDRPKRLGVLRVRTRYYNLLLLLCDEIWGLRQTRWRTRSIGPSRYGRHCGR